MLKHPGWPDVRGWVILGAFIITAYSLHMIEKNPALLANASFMQFIQTLTTGGILLIFGNLFGGNKQAADRQAANNTPPIAATGDVTVNNTSTDTPAP